MNAPVPATITQMPVTRYSAADIRAQVNLIQEVMQAVMKQDVHYGKIPGTPKPSLWKPGAEVLCATFRIAPSYQIEDLSTSDSIRYRVRCVGTHQTTGVVLGEGIGECSTGEEKYKWRKAASRKEFDATPENMRRIKYGYDKFERREYEVQQVRTEPADLANTILKMACKRAQVAMSLNTVAASDIFTQDIEDLPEELRHNDDERPIAASVSMPTSTAQTAGSIPAEQSGATEAGTQQPSGKMLTESQIRILKKKAESNALSGADIEAKFGKWEAIPFEKFAEIQKWIGDNSKL